MHKQLPQFDFAANKPVLRSILSRRDCRQWLPQEVNPEDIRQILYAATWAPNHKMTEPWKFNVILPAARSKFLSILAQGLIQTAANDNQKEDLIKKATQLTTEFSQVPAFIAIACIRDSDPVIERENLLTVGCACQNFLLAAEELGLSAHWGSGLASKTPALLEWLGWDNQCIPVGLFQVGYASTKPQTRRSPLEDFVRWH